HQLSAKRTISALCMQFYIIYLNLCIINEYGAKWSILTIPSSNRSKNLMLKINNATVIAIAHRLSTIKHLDRIVVMEGGKIVEDGNFLDLLTIPNGKFKELWEHQVNGMV
ncbi:MAG: hypothetical protein LN561_03515, partial [Rickettsia endosymbiont of Labidopullus appendiculatus]|nr:hypothetical protein [Rickettsia endosymbiont of Labidopullus appendiculatus]